MKPLSTRIGSIEQSATLRIASAVRERIAQGKIVIDFGVGEPNIDLFEPIKDAGKAAIDQNKSRYTPVAGIPALRHAIAEKLQRENDLHYPAASVVVSSGAKQSLYNVIASLANPADEFIVCAPYWVSYVDMIRLCQATPVIAACAEDLQVSAASIERCITPRTKAIVLNYPCNPTGSTINEGQLRAIAALAQTHDLYIISDEIYEYFSYEQRHVSIGALSADALRRTITINGVSKAYAMTGLRIGYAAGPAPIMEYCERLQSQVTSNPSSVAQYMALAALDTPPPVIAAMVETFRRKRDLCVQLLNDAGIATPTPCGAFYVFIDVSACHMSSQQFAERLLMEQGVAVVPGSAFGKEGFVRLSYATREDAIVEGIARLQQFYKAHVH